MAACTGSRGGPLKVLGVSWVGVKTAKFAQMRKFARDVLNLTPAEDAPDFSVFVMPDGDAFEIFGPNAGEPPAQFANNPIMVGFLVDDLTLARQELIDAGVHLIGNTERNRESGYAYQHFRGPDGLVYELAQDPHHR